MQPQPPPGMGSPRWTVQPPPGMMSLRMTVQPPPGMGSPRLLTVHEIPGMGLEENIMLTFRLIGWLVGNWSRNVWKDWSC